MGVLVTQSAKTICRVRTCSYGFRIQDTKLTNKSLFKKTMLQVTHSLSILHKLCSLHSRFTVYTTHAWDPIFRCVSFLQPTWICWSCSRLVNQAGKWHGDRRLEWVMALWNWVWGFSVAKSACEISQNSQNINCALRFVLQRENFLHRACEAGCLASLASWHRTLNGTWYTAFLVRHKGLEPELQVLKVASYEFFMQHQIIQTWICFNMMLCDKTMWAFWARNKGDALFICNERRQIHPNIPILWTRIGAIRARSSWSGAPFGGGTKLIADMAFWSPSSTKTFVFGNQSHACCWIAKPSGRTYDQRPQVVDKEASQAGWFWNGATSNMTYDAGKVCFASQHRFTVLTRANLRSFHDFFVTLLSVNYLLIAFIWGFMYLLQKYIIIYHGRNVFCG